MSSADGTKKGRKIIRLIYRFSANATYKQFNSIKNELKFILINGVKLKQLLKKTAKILNEFIFVRSRKWLEV